MTAAYKRERDAWRVMCDRCLNPAHADYPRYGAVGILICPQWQDSFAQFLKDVGQAPSADAWLGRLNTAGGYFIGNVVWTTHDEQVRRRQYCRRIAVDGKTMTAAEAGRLPGLPTRNSVLRRMKDGFDLRSPAGLARLDKRFIWITYQGETLPTSEWARRIGLPDGLLLHRAKAGMPVERVLHPARFHAYRPHKAKPETITN